MERTNAIAPSPTPGHVGTWTWPAGRRGSRVFNFGGGGVREKGSIDRTISQLLWTLAPKAWKILLSIRKWSSFFPTKYMANDEFSEPPRRADSNNAIFIFCRILGPGHFWGPGVSLARILGGPSIEPLLGEV